MPAPTEKKLLGEVLVDAGLITSEQLNRALKEQKIHGGRLGFHLVRLGLLTATKLTTFLVENLGVGVINERLQDRQKAADAIPRHLALYYKIAPLKISPDGLLSVAIAQIEHPNLMSALSEITGYKIDPIIYPETEIRALIDSSYSLPSDRGVDLFSLGDSVFTVVDPSRKIKPLAINQLKNERDVGEWLRSIIGEAIKEKSREILIKPEPDGSTISFKKDTFFLSEFALDSNLHDDLTFLLVRLSKMNTTQLQKPQHGRFFVKVHDRKIVMVTSAFPTIYGMRFVLEMFDEKVLKRNFEEATEPYPRMRELLQSTIRLQKPGLIVITGPEGSGRTTFLYSLLSTAKDDLREVITLEETVRYPLIGINQSNVIPENLDTSLEYVLKQHPNLVAINPLRNEKSAELAFLLAGRRPVIAVMSSYDTFMAVDWFCRHKLKSAVKAGLMPLVISPRLVPQVCANCSIPYEPDKNTTMKIPLHSEIKMNQGCEFCKNPDNHSSEMIFEYLEIDKEVLSWAEQDSSSRSLRDKARKASRRTLYDIGLELAEKGKLDMLSVLKLQPS